MQFLTSSLCIISCMKNCHVKVHNNFFFFPFYSWEGGGDLGGSVEYGGHVHKMNATVLCMYYAYSNVHLYYLLSFPLSLRPSLFPVGWGVVHHVYRGKITIQTTLHSV